ncbi:hypothetical protein BD413DRAFT_615035 [Trametes elegans]|nr:hypothetical protein BD413DRAFT_615035 [Trametes elegans]
MVNFDGGYTIVLDPEIGYEKRAELFISGLKEKTASATQEERSRGTLGKGACGRTISVKVVVDNSHPRAGMGVKGQRGTLHIQHPGRYS